MLLDLKIVGDTDLMNKAMFFQETVIKSATSTDTVTKRVKDNTRNEDKVNLTTPFGSLRLRHTVFATAHHIFAVIPTRFDGFAMGNRQEEGFLPLIAFEQGTQINLVMNGIVNHDSIGVSKPLHTLQLSHNGLGIRLNLLGRINTTLLLDKCTNSLLLLTETNPRKEILEIMYLCFE